MRSTNFRNRNHVVFLIKKRSEDAQYLISNIMIRSTEESVRKCP